MRTAAIGMALGFVALFAVLTVYVLLVSGLDVLVVVALIVLALTGLGVFGALGRTPPEDR